MRVLRIKTVCTAAVEEEWIVLVDDETADILLDEPMRALDALSGNELNCDVVDVKNTDVRDEEDREVLEVREATLT